MKTTNRAKRTAPEPEISEPLADPVPEDLAAAAAGLRQAAKDADEQAVRCRAEAESVVSASRAEADRIISEGQARALPLIADAGQLERQAADLGGRSKHLEHAARQEALAEEHEARAEDLAADLGRVTGTIAGLDSRLAELGAERERLEVERATARSGGDPRTVAGLVPMVEATDETMADLDGQREKALARAREIGDGTETGPGELLDALTAGGRHRAALTQALDELFPDRPGAEHRRDLARLQGALEGNLARIAEEAKAAPPQRRFGFADAH